ncbi:hypothetical protein HS7_11290 [Sulfolobales archaeon HS-7]|nr:hypothetical protein HS7_11290 [Sulfolobales archaeon HS-7]
MVRIMHNTDGTILLEIRRTRVVTMKMSDIFLKDVDDFAQTMGKTRSEIIRDAVAEYVKSIERDGKSKES